MEYWPCLMDIVYYSAKIITKLIEKITVYSYIIILTHKNMLDNSTLWCYFLAPTYTL
jgi:hypothetical protein